MSQNYIVSALYKFVSLPDYKELKAPLLKLCSQHNICGTLLLAHEGINGTVAGSRQAIDSLNEFLFSDARFAGMEIKESKTTTLPFLRMKVKIKKEIVTLGVPTVNPNESVGTYVNPQEWNELISDPEVVVVDTRNAYEIAYGTFKQAINPETRHFTQFPDFVAQQLDANKHKKIALCCTGGIRCEKASSFMINAGFKEVYHLKGGILKYLETIPENESLWQGSCFVFDNRVTVDHKDFNQTGTTL